MIAELAPICRDGGLLGGMRFYSAAEDQNHKLKGHQLVQKLVDHLGLETEAIRVVECL